MVVRALAPHSPRWQAKVWALRRWHPPWSSLPSTTRRVPAIFQQLHKNSMPRDPVALRELPSHIFRSTAIFFSSVGAALGLSGQVGADAAAAAEGRAGGAQRGRREEAQGPEPPHRARDPAHGSPSLLHFMDGYRGMQNDIISSVYIYAN